MNHFKVKQVIFQLESGFFLMVPTTSIKARAAKCNIYVQCN